MRKILILVVLFIGLSQASYGEEYTYLGHLILKSRFGYQVSNPETLNTELQAINPAFEIGGGMIVGAEFLYGFSDFFTIGFGFDYFSGSTESGGLQIRTEALPAYLLAGVHYFLFNDLTVGVSGGFGYTLTYDITYTLVDSNIILDEFKRRSPTIVASLIANYFAYDFMSFFIELGYRMYFSKSGFKATSSSTNTAEGSVFQSQLTGADMEVNMSGIFFLSGLSFYLF
jgi:hypothetical protein